MKDGQADWTTALAWIFTAVVTLGISYILQPAFEAAFHDQLRYNETLLPEPSNEASDDSKSESPTASDTMQTALLSLVIPAYNEQERIPVMLEEADRYLKSERGASTLKRLRECSRSLGNDAATATGNSNRIVIEWIIVNDGSKDCTDHAVRKEQLRLASSTADGQRHTWKLVNLRQNSGKGAAVKVGMAVSTGEFRLMVDADGATDFGPGLERLVASLHESIQTTAAEGSRTPTTMWAVFGSRAHLQNKAEAERSLVRTMLMHAFHFFVNVLISSKIQDTQCGFKLFTRDAAESCFSKLRLRRWAFDTEVVILSTYQGTKLLEVGVPWQEVDGSKLHTSKLALALVSISMLRDMVCVRACYSLGIWRTSLQKQERK